MHENEAKHSRNQSLETDGNQALRMAFGLLDPAMPEAALPLGVSRYVNEYILLFCLNLYS